MIHVYIHLDPLDLTRKTVFTLGKLCYSTDWTELMCFLLVIKSVNLKQL